METDPRIIDKFNSFVKKSRGCWLWNGPVCRDGYGALYCHNGSVRAHRFSYELHVGKIPAGMVVMHSCDTPACVNPRHLSLGTQRDNVRDMDSKGRRRPAYGDNNGSRQHPERRPRGDDHWARRCPEKVKAGEKHWKAKLTASDVSKIRLLHRLGLFTAKELRERFGISQTNTSAILRNKIWVNVTH